MREIKFRGQLLNGKWVYGLLCKPTKGKYSGETFISNSVGIPMAYDVRPETVGEYTGLKDKNGTEIYEGDIIRNHGFVNEGLVKFGRFVQQPQSKKDRPYWCQGFYVQRNIETNSLLNMKWKLNPFYATEESNNTLLIIGNIYEHPTMLKEE